MYAATAPPGAGSSGHPANSNALTEIANFVFTVLLRTRPVRGSLSNSVDPVRC